MIKIEFYIKLMVYEPYTAPQGPIHCRKVNPMKKIVISSAALILLSTTLTYAQEEQWYVGIEGSYSILKKETSQGTLLNLNTHFKDGVGVGGVVGYDFGMFRLEGEIGKHFHSLDRFTIINDGGLGLGGSSNQNALSGKSNATHYMMNAILDGGDLINMGSIEPFVGGGLGITNVKWSNFATSSNSLSSNADTVFGYQVFGGLRAALSPSVEVSLKYRYMDTGKSTRADRLGNAFKSTYDIHDVVVGLVYRFGAEKNTEIAKMPQPIKVITPKPVAMPDIEPAAGAAAVQPPPYFH
jgi:OmpA-OmpF porin, OOP family